MVQNTELNASDPVLGAVGTTYPTWSPLSGDDLLSLTLTLNSLSLEATADYHVDHVRIVTKVPDFTNTILLLGCALFGLGGTGWYVKRRRG